MFVVIRTKKPAQYFHGEIKKGFFQNPYQEYFITCISFSGGGRDHDPLEVIDYKSMSYRWLTERLRKFAKQQKYIIEFTKKPSTK